MLNTSLEIYKVKEQCSFFEELQQNLDDMISHPNQRVVLGGDFNVINDPDLDSSGGSPTMKESVKLLQDICLNYDLIDIWRIRNPDAKSYTWRQKKPLIQRRLDFWLTVIRVRMRWRTQLSRLL